VDGANRKTSNRDRAEKRVVGKLVRDKIPEVCRRHGQEPIVTVAAPEELRGLLLDKLAEEAKEVRDADAAGLPDELADVIEVAYALAADVGLSRADLERIRERKAAERGAFTRGLIWHGNQTQRKEAEPGQ
jgi:predicted house-cleaning noncanonical NTP pyrophosphatase (MazG superfamily)